MALNQQDWKPELAKWEHKILKRFQGRGPPKSLGYFVLDVQHVGNDGPEFCFCLMRPDNNHGPQRPHLMRRESPAELSALLCSDSVESERSIWFWLVQLVHYGLYTLSVRSRLRSQVLSRCKNILRNRLNRRGLTVPVGIKIHEKVLRAECAREKVGLICVGKKKAATEHEGENGAVPEVQQNHAHCDSNNNNSSDDTSSDDDSSDDSSSDGEDESCHPVDEGSVTADDSIARVQDQASRDDSDDHDDDHGDTSSLDGLPLRHRVRSAATDSTYREDDVDTDDDDDHSIRDPDPDSRDEGAYSIAELRILHNWRDNFCIKHKMTRAQFQVMMTRSHCRGNKNWTYGFVSKSNFLKTYRAQLPRREKSSMYNFRRTYNWNPPGEKRLTISSHTPVSSQWRRRSRLSMVDDRDDEDVNEEEAEILGARVELENADIWSLRATEALSDDGADHHEPDFDQQQEVDTHTSSASNFEHSNDCVSRTTLVENKASNLQREAGKGQGVLDTDIHMTDATSVVSDHPGSADMRLYQRGTFDSQTISTRLTGHTKAPKRSVRTREVAPTSGRGDRNSSQATPAAHQAKDATRHGVQSSASQEAIDDAGPVVSVVDRDLASVDDLNHTSRVAAKPAQEPHEEKQASIPSSSPRSRPLKRVRESLSAHSADEIAQTPTPSIFRNESVPLHLRSSIPQAEGHVVTHYDPSVKSLRTSIQSNPLQAIKRIAGNYGILFTQLSQIDEEEELDDFVDYVSKYVQKSSRRSISQGSKAGRTDNSDHLVRLSATENGRKCTKRQRSPEDDINEGSSKEIAEGLSRLGVENQVGRSLIEQHSRNPKRRKSISTSLNDEVDMSNDRADASGPSAVTIRASSLRSPTLVWPCGLARSASHPGTPSDSQPGTPYDRHSKQYTSRPGYLLDRSSNSSNRGTIAASFSHILDPRQQQTSSNFPSTTSSTIVTPTPKSDLTTTKASRSKRKPSFEYPIQTLATSGLSNLTQVRDQDHGIVKATHNPESLDAVAIDRNKPYGSQENPHIIPSTPKPKRAVDLTVKDEPCEESPLPTTSVARKDQSKGASSGKSKKHRSTVPRVVTPGADRSSSAFENPTPPSLINQGISRVADLRVGQSFSQSPSFSNVMRQDDRLYRRNQPKAVRNPTRDSRVQALVAHAQLDDHNLAALDSDDGKGKGNTRTQRLQTAMLSRQPQKHCPIPSVEQSDDDMWYQGSQSISNKVESQHNDSHLAYGSTSRKTRYNLGIPSVFQNKARQ